MCEIWGCCSVREERLLRKEGGVLFESRPWYGKRKIGWHAQLPGRPPDYIKGQIGGFILQYINFTMGADLIRFLLDKDITQSSLTDLPYMYSKHGDRGGGATWGQRRSHMGTEEEEPHGDRGGATWGQRRRSHIGTEEEEPHGDRGGGATWGQRRRSHM